MIKRKISEEESENVGVIKNAEGEGRIDLVYGWINIKCVLMAGNKSYGLSSGHEGCWSLTAKHTEAVKPKAADVPPRF